MGGFDLLRKIPALLLIPFIISVSVSSCLCVTNPNNEDSSAVRAFWLFRTRLDLSYDKSDVIDEIRPETVTRVIDINISICMPGIFQLLIYPYFKRSQIPVELSIEEIPNPKWIDLGISPGVVYPYLDSIIEKHVPQRSYLTVSLSPWVPGFKTFNLRLKAEAAYTPPFGSDVEYIDIPIKTGYYSSFRYEIPPLVEIGPGETAVLPIKITSYANAPSNITFEILDKHEGWNTSIVPEITIDSYPYGQVNNATVNFTVCSPNLSGIVDITMQFRVRVSTFATGHPDIGFDNTTVLQFTVRCRNY